MTTLSDAFLRLQLRFVREHGAARVMLLDTDRPADIVQRIHDLADEQGLAVAVDMDTSSISIVEAPAAAASG